MNLELDQDDTVVGIEQTIYDVEYTRESLPLTDDELASEEADDDSELDDESDSDGESDLSDADEEIEIEEESLRIVMRAESFTAACARIESYLTEQFGPSFKITLVAVNTVGQAVVLN